MNKDQREIERKLRILRYAEEIGHVAKAWLASILEACKLNKVRTARLPDWRPDRHSQWP